MATITVRPGGQLRLVRTRSSTVVQVGDLLHASARLATAGTPAESGREHGGRGMPTVAVVAHAGKSFGGGLGELRDLLAREDFTDPLCCEVTKGREAMESPRRALAQGGEV